jgi:type II secretory pathway predicted ATPase ExeA
MKSALEPQDLKFCLAVDAFCKRHKISVRRLSDLCDGYANHFSAASAHRFLKGHTETAVVVRMRPILAQALCSYLENSGRLPGEIESELSEIFDPQEFTKMIASRCPLTPEAVRFFGLSRDPFDVDHLPFGDEVFTNPELDAVAARVRDAVMYQRFVAVVGGVGSGKTLLKLRVAGELEEHGKCKLLYPEFFDMEEVTVGGIATQILVALGQVVPNDKTKRVNRIKDVLTQMQQEGIAVAIILDECHRLRDRVISSLKNFWEMTNGRSSRLLGVLLFGQPAFVESRLRDVRFKEIRQRVQIINMPELNGQSEAYLAHRLDTVGGDIGKLFEPEAIKRICINATTPLALGNLANEALMDAFHQEEKKVTASLPFFKKLSTGQPVLGIRRSA